MSNKAVWFPSKELMESTRLYQWMKKLQYDDYDQFLQAATKDISWFWQEAEKALDIEWFKPYRQPVDLKGGIKWPNWFVDGKLNATHNAIEKWENDPKMVHEPALIWEGEDGTVETYTYEDLIVRVESVAGGLKEQGLQRGDVIAIYLPMIPETVIVMMAAAKIGVIYSPIFSGYGAEAVATRLNAAEAKMLITADGFRRRGKEIGMKQEADRAVDKAPSVEKVIVVQRLKVLPTHWDWDRDVSYEDLAVADPEEETASMDTDEPLMLIYTSGTTGRPKGAVHTHAGFPIKAAFDAGFGMDVKKGDTLFWYTDMGWMMGPFLVYGGLLNGATIVMYEGTPDYPNPGRIWKIVEDHQVTHLGISPTLIRSLMQHGESWINERNLESLRVIGSTGEPWNPEPWLWLFEKVGNKTLPIFNYSGGTEISGGILANVLLKPIEPITFNSALPGMDVDVFNEHGKSVTNSVGELVIKSPWVGMTNGFWKESGRYEEAYWSRWSDIWVHGDWVVKDDDGYWTITGRSDDILNVAGKRLGPAEVESILVSHPSVIEAGTIGVPDDIKGEAVVCFAVLHANIQPSDEIGNDLLNLVARRLGKALRPKSVYFIKDLPKTRNAKVMRRAIRAAFLHKDAGDLSSLENPQALQEISSLTTLK